MISYVPPIEPGMSNLTSSVDIGLPHPRLSEVYISQWGRNRLHVYNMCCKYIHIARPDTPSLHAIDEPSHLPNTVVLGERGHSHTCYLTVLPTYPNTRH